MPITQVFDPNEARKLGFRDEIEAPAQSERVKSTTWVYPDEMQKLIDAYGEKLQKKIDREFERVIDDLIMYAEIEIERKSENQMEEA
jgi:hypothetical protein